MKDFVVDNSVVLSWVFEDEHSKVSQSILNELFKNQAYVPSLWPFELANALYVAEKRGRIKEADSMTFIKNLKDLPICIENNNFDNITKDILALSRKHSITVYDASYVELALRKNLPLITFNKELIVAAKKIGLKLT